MRYNSRHWPQRTRLVTTFLRWMVSARPPPQFGHSVRCRLSRPVTAWHKYRTSFPGMSGEPRRSAILLAVGMQCRARENPHVLVQAQRVAAGGHRCHGAHVLPRGSGGNAPIAVRAELVPTLHQLQALGQLLSLVGRQDAALA